MSIKSLVVNTVISWFNVNQWVYMTNGYSLTHSLTYSLTYLLTYSLREDVLIAYRDVNELFGDIVKVTPSSKCVGDLALYLVTRNLSTTHLLNGNTKIDFPESVVGLFKGELGLPHRGFPKEIENIILKGSEKLKDRPGLLLPPINIEENIKTLTAKFNQIITAEQAMSYLMYPKVFSDYITKQQKTR